jgi:hypothetical protein
VVVVAKAHAVRLDDETTEWLERYAEERGTDKGTILRSAVAAFREDVRAGVPDLEPAPVLDARSPEDGRGKVSRPVVPAVPGVKRGSEVLADRQRALNKKIQGWS